MINKKIGKALGIILADMMLLGSAFSASAAMLGDTTGDKIINATDATDILTEYARVSINQASQFSAEQKEAADVDKNGVINAVDAAYVLSYYAYKATGGTSDFETYLNTSAAPQSVPYGKWDMDKVIESDFDIENGGIELKNNGKGSVYLDSSDMMKFTAKGFEVNHILLPMSQYNDDGSTISLVLGGDTMLSMTRISTTEGYYGKYKLNSCYVYEQMKKELGKQGVFDESKLNITIDFSGEESVTTFNDLFSFKADGNKLVFSDFTGFLNGEGSTQNASAQYSVSGSKLTLTTDNGTSTFTKAG